MEQFNEDPVAPKEYFFHSCVHLRVVIFTTVYFSYRLNLIMIGVKLYIKIQNLDIHTTSGIIFLS